MTDDNVPPDWASILEPVLSDPGARRLGGWLRAEEDAGRTVYPPRGQRLRAFELTSPDKVRVVILGQDPYHGPGQAHGLAFSVPESEKVPPSLRNIFKELQDDCGVASCAKGDLTRWASQGVLLLNNALTVEAAKAGSHQKRGWEAITDAAVAAISARDEPSVFILWGNHAQAKAERIGLGDDGPHLVIRSPHPSPLSAHRGFFGSRPFSRANAFLMEHGRGRVDW